MCSGAGFSGGGGDFRPTFSFSAHGRGGDGDFRRTLSFLAHSWGSSSGGIDDFL